jgi:hypothetical protein
MPQRPAYFNIINPDVVYWSDREDLSLSPDRSNPCVYMTLGLGANLTQ